MRIQGNSALLGHEIDGVQPALFPFLVIRSRLRKENVRESLRLNPIPRNDAVGFRFTYGVRTTGPRQAGILGRREPSRFTVEFLSQCRQYGECVNDVTQIAK